MKKTKDVIAALHKKHGSYYRIAKVLGVSEGAVYFLRDGESIMSNRVARRAAEDLGENFEALVCAAEVERAEKSGDAQEASAWRRRLEALRQHAAAVVLGIIAASTFHSGESIACAQRDSTSSPSNGSGARDNASSLYYVKLLRRGSLRPVRSIPPLSTRMHGGRKHRSNRARGPLSTASNGEPTTAGGT